ncbi:hypothetical protein CesoFtcFv8_000205 [Champsocephalus esox]|uniref:Uncharacterized protein n=1 Tax=Champsocephalus esox TaxID=159716 RepID=A0AAN8E2T1_9TELE|nr:hypothetical protein CesoFtcFv8_000205 [Champsocephalus esox]
MRLRAGERAGMSGGVALLRASGGGGVRGGGAPWAECLPGGRREVLRGAFGGGACLGTRTGGQMERFARKLRAVIR